MDKFKHFLEAQGRVYPQVIKELKEGHKKLIGCGLSFRS